MAAGAVLRALRILRPRTLAATSGKFLDAAEFVLPPASCELYTPWGSSPVRRLQVCSALCAGHNKWSKVKHIKGPKDVARSRMFVKFALLIKVAVKEGGPNPGMNVNLANVLEQCRSKNMPKSSIENAIKTAAKPASQYTYEARGPGGCMLLIDVLTDNTSSTFHEIKRLLTKNRGMLSDGVRHNFIRKGVVVVPGQNISTERALELAIEAGAEDVQESEDEEEQPVLKFMCDMVDTSKVRASLGELGLEIASAGLEFVPRTSLSLSEDQLEAALMLVEALSDCPDVVQVWDNIQADS
ncbi:hypothetical protein PBY51_001670 [Eleginops maclovinus]|uniref:Translational activator of cytochrome c oxidase 1 n=1 Tax=Eleginops maclovinus TaxID=56733 RepID=A0AAN8AD98_ELEMC|nr:hypothetical protein PBY51_001670 [Eleginops maclovinus]